MAQGSYCRNGKDGEWNYYHIDEDAGPNATGDAYIDWKTFRKGLGPTEWDPDRYFRWRKYWAYGNGIMSYRAGCASAWRWRAHWRWNRARC